MVNRLDVHTLIYFELAGSPIVTFNPRIDRHFEFVDISCTRHGQQRGILLCMRQLSSVC